MKLIKFVIIVLFISMISACIGFRGGQLGDINGWPPTIEKKKSISYVLTGKVDMSGQLVDAQPETIKGWKKYLDETYRDSGLFSSVEDGFTEADIRAEVVITDEGRGSYVLAFISGFTLCVIPAYASDTIIIQTTFKDSSGDVLGEVSKQEKISVWIQILLLPVSPFKWPFSIANDVLYDINRAILLEAHQKGIL